MIRSGARIAAGVALLACFAITNLWASEPSLSQGPMIQRSMRVVPRRYAISPSGPTIPVNQTRHFAVIDSDGKPVTVRWNISGLGCYGASCGSIDEQGIYHPPAALPQPRVVTLEGVVVSDPHYSVLTEIRLEGAAATNVSVALAKSTPEPPLAAPEVPQGMAGRVESMPLPGAVAAAPGAGRAEVARKADLMPLPPVVRAAPEVDGKGGARHSERPPVPPAVAATPKIGSTDKARTLDLVLMPSAVAAAPPIGAQGIASRAASVPVPPAVSNTPSVVGARIPRAADSLALPPVVSAAPIAGSQSASRNAALPQVTAAPAPVASAQGLTVNAQPLNAQPLLLAKAEPQGGAMVRPLPNATSVSAPEPVAQDGVRVVYSNGQLTIDAQNTSLADVLKLVAQKTGSTIDVPPGTGLEPIFEHAGPGNPNDVLTQLLNGSRFNFIIVNSQQNPEALAQVLLSVRPSDADVAIVAQAPTPAPEPPPNGSPYLYHPPENAAPVPNVPRQTAQGPSEPLSPEALGEIMKERIRAARDKFGAPAPPQ